MTIDFEFVGASFVSGVVAALALTQYISPYWIVLSVALLFSFDFGGGKTIIHYSSKTGWEVKKDDKKI